MGMSESERHGKMQKTPRAIPEEGSPEMTDTASAPNVVCKLLHAVPHGLGVLPKHAA